MLGRAVLDGLFVVKKLIGEGGMGLVLHVTHREWNVDLAVKIPKVEAVNRKGNRERFIQEAETWIELGSHPHIVQLWYVREYQGLPVLFLDYLPHGSLKDLLKSKYWRPQHWPGILDLSLQIVDGLSYTHGCGVVHRDIKPANILLRDQRHACLTDFGLVKVMDTSFDQMEQESNTTTIGGTPLYASPEQWEGRVGPTVDIYSTGVILYELCAGKVPFKGKNNLETILMHRTEEPPPFEAPERLRAIILKCLAKEPMDRPPLDLIRQELVGTFKELTGKTYPRPVPEPKEQRATALNNKALSLWSLGRVEPAFEAWDEACQADGRHPQAIFNRALARWRRAELKEEEAIRQLEVAQAWAQLGFFLLEAGYYQQALEYLAWATNNSDEVERGVAHRALGDANMYLGQFASAEHAYAAALKLMPADQLALGRQQLAKMSTVEYQGRTFFPPRGPVCQDQAPSMVEWMHIEPQTGALFSKGRGWLSCRHPQTGALLWRVRLAEGEILGLACDLQVIYPLGGNVVLSLLDGQVKLELPHPLVQVHLPSRQGLMGDQLVSLDDGSPRVALRKRFAAASFTVAAFLDEGKTLVTGSPDGWLELWNTEDGVAQGRLRLEDTPVLRLVALESGGIWALTGSGRVVLWDRGTQEKLFELKGPFVGLRQAASGGYLILRGPDKEFVVFDPERRQAVFRGRGPVAVCSDGVLYVEDGYLSLWSLTRAWRPRRWEQHQQPVTSVAVMVGGARVVTGGQRGLLQWWQLDEPYRVHLTEFQVARGATYTETEKTGDAYERAIKEFQSQFEVDPRAAWALLQQARALQGYARAESAMAGLAQYYRRFARDSLVDLWEKRYLTLDHLPYKVGFHDGKVSTLDLHGNYREFTESGACETVTGVGSFDQGVLGLREGEVSLAEVSVSFDMPIQNLVVDREAKRTVVATEEGHLHQVDLRVGEVLRRVPDQDHPTRILVGSPGLNRVISGPQWHIWDFATGVHRKGPVAGGQIEAADLSRDATYAVTSNLDHKIQLWRLSDGHLCVDIEAQSSPLVTVQLWEHLNVIVTVASGGLLCLWDVATGECLRSFDPHAGVIKAAWVDKEGRHMVTVGADRHLRVWEFEWSVDLDRTPPTLEEQFGKRSALKRFFTRR